MGVAWCVVAFVAASTLNASTRRTEETTRAEPAQQRAAEEDTSCVVGWSKPAPTDIFRAPMIWIESKLVDEMETALSWPSIDRLRPSRDRMVCLV